MARKPQYVQFDLNQLDSVLQSLDAQQPAAQTQEEPEDIGFFDKVINTGLAIGEGLTRMPGAIIDTIGDTIDGGNINVADQKAIEARMKTRAEDAAYQKKYDGKAFEGVTGAMLSIPYSVTTMLPVTLGQLAPIPGGTALGAAASYGIADRATQTQFMYDQLDRFKRENGRMPTPEEWNNITELYADAASEYGTAEALPEAVGNFAFSKILGPFAKNLTQPIFGGGGVKGAAKGIIGDNTANALRVGEMSERSIGQKMASAAGRLSLAGLEENATETWTQYDQGAIEARTGLRDAAPTLGQAFREQAPITGWQTLLMGLGGKAANTTYNRYKYGQWSDPSMTPTEEQQKTAELIRDLEKAYNSAVESGNTEYAKKFYDAFQNMERDGQLSAEDYKNLENYTFYVAPLGNGQTVNLTNASSQQDIDAFESMWNDIQQQHRDAQARSVQNQNNVTEAANRQLLEQVFGSPDPFTQTQTPTQTAPASPTPPTAFSEGFGTFGWNGEPSTTQNGFSGGNITAEEADRFAAQNNRPDLIQAPDRFHLQWTGRRIGANGMLEMRAQDGTRYGVHIEVRPDGSKLVSIVDATGQQAVYSNLATGPEAAWDTQRLVDAVYEKMLRERGFQPYAGVPAEGEVNISDENNILNSGPFWGGTDEFTAQPTPPTRPIHPVPQSPQLTPEEQQVLDAVTQQGVDMEGQPEEVNEDPLSTLGTTGWSDEDEGLFGETPEDIPTEDDFEAPPDDLPPFPAGEHESAGTPPTGETGQNTIDPSKPIDDFDVEELNFGDEEVDDLLADLFDSDNTDTGASTDAQGTAEQSQQEAPQETGQSEGGKKPLQKMKKQELLDELPEDVRDEYRDKSRAEILEEVKRRKKKEDETTGEAQQEETPTETEQAPQGTQQEETQEQGEAQEQEETPPQSTNSTTSQDSQEQDTATSQNSSGTQTPEESTTHTQENGSQEIVPGQENGSDTKTTDENVSSENVSEENTSEQPTGTSEESSEENTTDQFIERPENKTNYGTIENPNISALADYFAERLYRGKKYSSIVEARKEAGELLGGRIEPGTKIAKDLEEAIELGVRRLGDRIIRQERRIGQSDVEIYRHLVSIYEQQPILGGRSSDSIARQAYSTPVPIAFLASHLAGIRDTTSVYEPTAGNGMLLIGASLEHTSANELDHERAERLRGEGFTVTEEDATTHTLKDKVDVVIANPPFGHVHNGDEVVVFDQEGLRTPEIDHAIVKQALAQLKENGRAVIIIGGKQGRSEDERKQKYRAAAQVRFYRFLNNNYNLQDHFTIDGKLYGKQGASYPIDVLVIQAGSTSHGRNFPGGELPRTYKSFEDLEELFNEREVGGTESASDGVQSTGESEGSNVTESNDNTSGEGTNAQVPGSDGGVQGEGETGDTAGGTIVDAEGNGSTDSENNIPPATVNEPGGDGGSDISDSTDTAGQGDNTVSDNGGEHGAGTGRTDNESGSVGNVRVRDSNQPVERTRRQKEQEQNQLQEDFFSWPWWKPERAQASEFQVNYDPGSKHKSLDTLIAKGMASAAQHALDVIVEEHGDIDEYVARELGYTKEELGKYLGAEQIDAVALAIHSMGKGGGFIIGDQTGIGKGRVNASIIRWAKNKGLMPVFITQKPQLYTDMMRDLTDIGVKEFNPFYTNNRSAIQRPDGKTTKTGDQDRKLNDIASGKDKSYDMIFTNYSQLMGANSNRRREFLENMRDRCIFILDEAHSAAGEQGQQRRSRNNSEQPQVDSLTEYMQNLLFNCNNGVFYSSATYAKRPGVMALYCKTDMRYAVSNPAELGEAIARGGIPLQQIVANMLAQAGQYIRRERSYAGIEVSTDSIEVDTQRADDCSNVLLAIQDFNLEKNKAVKALNNAAANHGGSVRDLRSANSESIKSTNFSSVMHNLVSQLMTAYKVDSVVETAVNDIKAGKKPVIALENTMASFLESYAKENGLNNGDTVDLTFKNLFLKYLEKARTKKGRDEDGNEIETLLTDEELGPKATALYRRAKGLIQRLNFDDLDVSFIDAITEKLEAQGYKVGEITGRTMRLVTEEGQKVLRPRKAGVQDRVDAVNKFNSGEIDVMILNSAGATGISMHASEKFKDQRPRTMYIMQPAGDINTFMQMLGRINRTGQVAAPSYRLMFTNIPSEKRVAANLARKMASLNANTTASKDSDTSFKDIPDFMNRYGDTIAENFAHDNQELVARLGLTIAGDRSGLMSKFTGYLPLLPVHQQEEILGELESGYNALIQEEIEQGSYDLEAETREYDAVELNKEVFVEGEESENASPFQQPAYITTYDVKVIGKPLTPKQARERFERGKDISLADVHEKIRKFISGSKHLSEEAKDRLETECLRNLDVIKSISQRFHRGQMVYVETRTDSYVGMISNFTSTGSTKNPTSLSQWNMEVIVNDPMKTLHLSFIKLRDEAAGSSDLSILANPDLSQEQFYESLKNGQNARREKKKIITGNILKGYSYLDNRGRIIFFKDREGNTIPGIVVPDTTLDAVQNQEKPLTPEQGIEFLDNNNSGVALIDHTNTVIVSHQRLGYSISVPKAKRTGGAYFQNDDLIRITGMFFKKGDRMIAGGLPRSDLKRALEYMTDTMGLRFRGFEPQARASLSGAQGTVTKKDVEKQIAGKLKGIDNVEVVQSYADLPSHVRRSLERQHGRDAGTKTEGAYDPQTGKSFIIADNLENTERAEKVLVHEHVVHNGLDSLFGRNKNAVLNDLYDNLSREERSTLNRIARAYGLDLSNESQRLEATEELVAHMGDMKAKELLNTPAQKSLWNRIVDWVKNLLGKVFGVTHTTSETEKLLRDLANYARNGNDVNVSHRVAELRQMRKGDLLKELPTQERKEFSNRTRADILNQAIRNTQNRFAHAEQAESIGKNAKAAIRISALFEDEQGKRTFLGRAIDKLYTRGNKELAEAAMDNTELRQVVSEGDINAMTSSFVLPSTIAHEHENFDRIFQTERNRSNERKKAIKSSLEECPHLFGEKRLNAKEQQELAKLAFDLDGKKFQEENAVGRFKERQVLANGCQILDINPDYYPVYDKIIDRQNVSQNVKDAMKELRRSLDNDFIAVHNQFANMQGMTGNVLKKFRNEFGEINHYVPHMRKGNYFFKIERTGADGKKRTVYREHFDAHTEREAEIKAKAIRKRLNGTYQGDMFYGKNEKFADDVLGAPFDFQASMQILKEATKNIQVDDEEQRKQILETIAEGTANILKSRGFPAHAIRRSNIPGYIQDDIAGVIFDYKSGLYGWLTKLKAAQEFGKALGDIDARKQPELFRYAKTYTHDMLRNSDDTDRLANNLKMMFFYQYLGGSLKTAFVNGTQNLIVGLPRLGQDVTGGRVGLLMRGASDAIAHATSKGKHLQGEEAKLLQELQGENIINDNYMEAVRTEISKESAGMLAGPINKLAKLLGMPMSIIERFNRATLALAAFRAAKQGLLKESTKAKYGITGPATYEQAKQFASDIVDDSHFIYGKTNAPQALRGDSKASRLASTMYTFRTFSHNMLGLYWKAMKQKDFKFLGESMGMAAALGGLAGIPLYATFSQLYLLASGDDEDWKTKLKRMKYFQKHDMQRDLVCYGLPSLAGVNLGGSLALETFITRPSSQAENLWDFIVGSAEQVAGIPAAFLRDNVSKGLEHAGRGQYYRAAEDMMPVFLKNIMTAYRLKTEGQTTSKGVPFDGALTYDMQQAIKKAMGFQPVEATKSWEAFEAGKLAESVRKGKLDVIARKVLSAEKAFDNKAYAKAMKELQDWNVKQTKAGKDYLCISQKSLTSKLNTLRKAKKPSKTMEAVKAGLM